MSKSKIYAFDFDETLAHTKYPEILSPIVPMVNYAKRLKAAGNTLILWTNREGPELDAAVRWCADLGLIFDAVNDNCEEMKQFFGSNPRKIFANEYIDDHNAIFTHIPDVDEVCFATCNSLSEFIADLSSKGIPIP